MSFYWSTMIRRGVLAQLTSLITVIFLVAAMPALALFHICQESLANIARHSRARHAEVHAVIVLHREANKEQ